MPPEEQDEPESRFAESDPAQFESNPDEEWPAAETADEPEDE